MRIVLIADTFPPLRTSGAVQLRDLSREFVRQGHDLTILLPASDQVERWRQEEVEGFRVIRLKAPRTKDIGYIRRTLGELMMPFAMLRNLRNSPMAKECWECVIWYSPSIFHGPLAHAIKKKCKCKGYMIIRDIFPEWAVDMGLMGRGLPYRFFDAIARYQYAVADVIGVQTSGNLSYFNGWNNKRLEVLNNWLDKPTTVVSTIQVQNTLLSGRKILVYAGNMGIAQGMDIMLDLAERFLSRQDIGFLFVGRGSAVENLKSSAVKRRLNNVLFFDEIHPDEIPDLYQQCSAGIVSLDSRHRSHNIPGKFLTYMQSGLPVLASVNAGNDLADLIRQEQVGQVCETHRIEDLQRITEELLNQIDSDQDLQRRCIQLFKREYAVEKGVKQIISALNS